MQVITKTLELAEKDYYIAHVGVVNALKGGSLSKMEMLVFAGFLYAIAIHGAENAFQINGRKSAKEFVGTTSPAIISNHIRSLRDKKWILGEDNKLEIPTYLIPESDWQGYKLKLVNNRL